MTKDTNGHLVIKLQSPTYRMEICPRVLTGTWSQKSLSPFNRMDGSSKTLIDTLTFEIYQNLPWGEGIPKDIDDAWVQKNY